MPNTKNNPRPPDGLVAGTMPEKRLSTIPPETPGENEYPLLRATNMQDILATLRENAGPAGISSLDLPRIKCPSGGALSWIVPSLDGETSTKEIEGIVVAWRPGRLYWKRPMGEGGGRRPPDCISRDGFIGVGDPGGECSDCPYAQFGSAAKGHGQACKSIRQLLIVRPGEILPHLISVPPTSLRPASQYFLMLLGRQIPYWAVTTRIRLEKATNDDGIAYARMQFLAGRQLNDAERIVLGPYHAQMKSMLDPLTIDARDYGVAEEGQQS